MMLMPSMSCPPGPAQALFPLSMTDAPPFFYVGSVFVNVRPENALRAMKSGCMPCLLSKF
jgi:hypothetical protein